MWAAGNMAHLLNHSCAPNCVSRNHTIMDPASGESADHVIIFALRDISPAEELTYDYRLALCRPADASLTVFPGDLQAMLLRELMAAAVMASCPQPC